MSDLLGDAFPNTHYKSFADASPNQFFAKTNGGCLIYEG